MSEWISVKDRLPEEGIRVLTLDKYSEYRIDYIVITETLSIWACRLLDDNANVLYWMPLPKPPQG